MHFRIATLADVTALAQVRWEWRTAEVPDGPVDESHDAFIERFARFAHDGLTGGRWAVWVADDGDGITAQAWIYRVPKVPSPGRTHRDFGYLTNVYTRPEVRNQGVGGQLLAAVTEWAHGLDLEMVIVWPSERSVPWYERAGFAPSEEMLELEISGYEG